MIITTWAYAGIIIVFIGLIVSYYELNKMD